MCRVFYTHQSPKFVRHLTNDCDSIIVRIYGNVWIQQLDEINEWIRESNAFLTQLDELLAGIDRKTRYDRNLEESELFQQIDDELSSRQVDSNAEANIELYSNRLVRFCKNIDYFIDNEVTPLGISSTAHQTRKRPPVLRRRGNLYNALKNDEEDSVKVSTPTAFE